MKQAEIKEERNRLERRMRRLFKIGIKTTEEILELEKTCKNPNHGKKQKCPDCGKTFK